MKKSILLLAILLSCGLFSIAQDLNNKVLVGGVLDFYSSNDDTETSTTKSNRFGISPMVGYYFSPKIVAGLAGSYSYRKYETTREESELYNLEDNINTYLLGPFARYHFNPVDKFTFFLHIEALYGKENGQSTRNYVDEQLVSDIDGNRFQSVLQPGISYRVSDKISFEAQFISVSYIYAKTEETSEGREPISEKSSVFGVSLNRISLGLAVLL